MNIRSIDLQVLIPRATEAGKVQQTTNQQPIVEQQQFAEQFQAIANSRQRQVQNVPKPEDGKIHNQKEKEHQQSKHQQRDDSYEEEDVAPGQEDDIPDPIKGHVIDIKT